jgi:hypothetical protein
MPTDSRPYALLELVWGAMVTQAIYTAAELGVADAIGDTSLTPAQVAEKVGADADTTERLLRLLAGNDLLAADGAGYVLTPQGQLLRSDVPGSLRPIARLMGHPRHWEDWGGFTDAIRTGEPAVPALRGMSMWEYVAADPQYGEIFIGGMGCLAGLETEAVIAAGEFSRFTTIVDVGGGIGTLLAAILTATPGARGVLSAPPSVAAAEHLLQEAGVADRATVFPGFYLDAVPTGGDAYLLKHVLHDWPPAQVRKTLDNVRSAIGPDGRLLLMEFVLPDDDTPHLSRMTNLWLHLLVGGRERTRDEYARVLAESGFRLVGVTPTTTPLSIVEAEPV